MQKDCSRKMNHKRSQDEFQKLLHRLNRIEGQVRGVKKMLENNAYCTDILMQSSAISAAINAFNKELLSNHIRHCVVADIKQDNNSIETIDELVQIVQRLMK